MTDMNTQIDSIHRLIQEDLSLDEQITCLKTLSLDELSVETIVEAVHAFRKKMIFVDLPNKEAVDLAGTGGDKSNSFNISTTASIVAAAAGTPIAKHGNVSISSKSGGIDLLRMMNLPIPDTKEEAIANFEKDNIVFFFAQTFHPIFKKFSPARKALAGEGVITLFNILGPLLNPAKTPRSINGVFRADLVELVAEVKAATGTTRSLVMHGNGMDELSLTGQNTIAEIKDGKIICETKMPEDFGLSPCTAEDIEGGTPEENAKITYGIFDGSITGAKKDIVVLNAAAAIYVGSDLLDFSESIEAAQNAIETGEAQRVLERLST